MFKMEGEILYLAVKIISPNVNNLFSIIVAVVIRQFETEMHCGKKNNGRELFRNSRVCLCK